MHILCPFHQHFDTTFENISTDKQLTQLVCILITHSAVTSVSQCC